jgi:hypothetical protein
MVRTQADLKVRLYDTFVVDVLEHVVFEYVEAGLQTRLEESNC